MRMTTDAIARLFLLVGGVAALAGGWIGSREGRIEHRVDEPGRITRSDFAVEPRGWPLVVAGGLLLGAGVVFEIETRRRPPRARSGAADDERESPSV
jgi:hypothetical protein